MKNVWSVGRFYRQPVSEVNKLKFDDFNTLVGEANRLKRAENRSGRGSRGRGSRLAQLTGGNF